MTSPDLRFPLDGAVELHFSATPEIRLPSPAPTPAVPVDTTDDPVTRWDSYENIVAMGSPLDGDTDTEDINGESVQHESIFSVFFFCRYDINADYIGDLYINFV